MILPGSAAKTKLKHIDCRQEWVKVLRNKDILKPVHVDSKDNVADLFTKILPRGTFERLRDSIMTPLDRTADPRDTSQDPDSDDGDYQWDDYQGFTQGQSDFTPSEGVIEKTAGFSRLDLAHPRRAHAPARGSASKAGG